MTTRLSSVRVRGVFAIAFVALSSLAASCKDKGPPAPSPVVVAFYSVRIASKSTGAPSANALRQFAPFLSDTLTSLLRAAGEVRDREAARAPDEKPPFVEGDLFSSLFEGPTSFVVLRDTVAARQKKSVVRFTNIYNGESYTWTDTVLLGKRGRNDVIEDVLYGGAGDFGNHGTLRTSLESALVPMPQPVPAPATKKTSSTSPEPLPAPSRGRE